MKDENKEIKQMNLYEKMSLITDEVGVVEKKLNVEINKSKSYKAVSERDILDAVKPIEKKYRVYSYPYKREIVEKDIISKQTDYGSTNQFYIKLQTVYRFVNIDNPEDYIDVDTYGDGIDTGDKSSGKAMTYADKYAIMKAYKISTGDDPDKDASPQKGYKKQEKQTEENKDDNQDLQLTNQFQRALVDSGQDLDEMLKYFEVDTVSELSIDQKKQAIAVMNAKIKKANILEQAELQLEEEGK